MSKGKLSAALSLVFAGMVAAAGAMAAETGNFAAVRRLLEAGADPNERIASRDTALMMAARSGNVDTIKLLLDRGADVLARDYKRLMRANMAEEIDRFVGALDAGAILPEDF